MKKRTLSFVLVLCTSWGLAQPGLMQNISEFKSAVQRSSGSIESIESKFEQRQQLSIMSSVISSSGMFYFELPEKVRWEYETPVKQSIVLNGDQVHFIEDGNVRKADARAARAYKQMNEVIADVIHGDAFSNKAFSYLFLKSEGSGAVEMRPTDEGMRRHIEKIELDFNLDHRVESLTIYVPGGDFTTYRFFDQSYNKDIPNAVFEPKPVGK